MKYLASITGVADEKLNNFPGFHSASPDVYFRNIFPVRLLSPYGFLCNEPHLNSVFSDYYISCGIGVRIFQCTFSDQVPTISDCREATLYEYLRRLFSVKYSSLLIPPTSKLYRGVAAKEYTLTCREDRVRLK